MPTNMTHKIPYHDYFNTDTVNCYVKEKQVKQLLVEKTNIKNGLVLSYQPQDLPEKHPLLTKPYFNGTDVQFRNTKQKTNWTIETPVLLYLPYGKLLVTFEIKIDIPVKSTTESDLVYTITDYKHLIQDAFNKENESDFPIDIEAIGFVDKGMIISLKEINPADYSITFGETTLMFGQPQQKVTIQKIL